MKLFSNVCDKCGKPPVAFECGNEEFAETDMGFYHVVPRQCDDATTLMSNGDLVFKICITPEHPILEEEAYICSDCFVEIFGYGDDIEFTEDIDDA